MFLTRQPTEVENVNAGVITSEPSGKFNASIPIYKADDPEFTYKQYFLLKSLAIWLSTFLSNYPFE